MRSTFSKNARALVLGSLLYACSGIGFSQQMPAPDNTRNNDRAGAATADQQSNAASDRELTKSVRKAILQDKTLSTYAHNVKVVSQNGQVTLTGPVRSEDEKQAIVAKAAEVAGKDKVVDELTVAPQNH